jgi:hypothetical protein
MKMLHSGSIYARRKVQTPEKETKKKGNNEAWRRWKIVGSHTHTQGANTRTDRREMRNPPEACRPPLHELPGAYLFPFACICNSEFSFCYFPFFCLPGSRRSLSCLLFRECERNDSRHFSKVLLLLLVVLCS